MFRDVPIRTSLSSESPLTLLKLYRETLKKNEHSCFLIQTLDMKNRLDVWQIMIEITSFVHSFLQEDDTNIFECFEADGWSQFVRNITLAFTEIDKVKNEVSLSIPVYYVVWEDKNTQETILKTMSTRYSIKKSDIHIQNYEWYVVLKMHSKVPIHNWEKKYDIHSIKHADEIGTVLDTWMSDKNYTQLCICIYSDLQK